MKAEGAFPPARFNVPVRFLWGYSHKGPWNLQVVWLNRRRREWCSRILWTRYAC